MSSESQGMEDVERRCPVIAPRVLCLPRHSIWNSIPRTSLFKDMQGDLQESNDNLFQRLVANQQQVRPGECETDSKTISLKLAAGPHG